MRKSLIRTAVLAALAAAASGCAAAKSWWYSETGRMDEAEAAARGYPDCAGLTLETCGRKHPPAPAQSREPAVSK